MQQFKCPLCRHQYAEENPPRLLTMCGHTFCHDCINANIQHHNYKYEISCPLDKLTISLDSNTPSHFPRNMAILELIAHCRHQKSQKELKGSGQQLILEQECGISVSGPTSQQYIEQKKGVLRQSMDSAGLANKNQGQLCLLHQKPLDIICTQQKCTICAQCALFGMHKGHAFTTMKELLSKQHTFIRNAGQLVAERTQIDHKIKNGQFQSQISLILQKKKQLLLYQLSNIIKNITASLLKFEQAQHQKIQSHITQMKNSLQQQLKTCMQSNGKFDFWLANIQRFTDAQNKNIDHLILISQCFNRSINQIEKGKNLVQNIKRQLIDFWNQLQKKIEHPTIRVLEPIQTYLQANIQVKWFEQKRQNSIIDLSQLKIWSQINVSAIMENSFIAQQPNVLKHVKTLQNEYPYEGSTRLSEIFHRFDDQTSEKQQRKPILRKVKSRDLTIHSTLFNQKDKGSTFKSPRTKLKIQASTTKLICSPLHRNSLKKYCLKVKDCQKFLRIVDGLQSNCLQVADFTGFELGDQIARQVCITVLESNKVKMLKMMKNQLTDSCIKEVIDVLRMVDYVNLAQNGFTEKIIQHLLVFSSKNSFNKMKNIQLGQNQINSRRLKEKIDQLKKYRITITL